MTDFYNDVVGNSSSDEMITPAEETQLLATTLPAGVSTAEAAEFIDRWNRTVQYWFAGIVTSAQVPTGQSTDFLDAGALQIAFGAARNAEQASQADGYTDPAAEYRAALVTVQNDLAGKGVCATVKLQINQSATLTRSAFTGTLSITNSGGMGAISNVVMNINITDAQGNPANGEFYVSSPTYSGAFSVVNGVASLPANSTGTITFTFIPDDSAATNGPTIYHIGGTIGYTGSCCGAVTIPVFPSTITVEPQAQLQLNYFLQQSVIGDDPSTPQVEPSEPAVLGMLVTNVGGGAANNLSITTAQPQIIQNQKGLADNFQIIGTQVGTQQVTPSLTVDLGNVAPGQTADADFLLLSSLQGAFENFSATFTHTDALGGSKTSLISSVKTHALVHAGNFNYPGSTGEMDYLVNDIPNPENLPDTIYFSDGTTAPVNVATNATSSPVGPSGQLTFQVTANVTSGWDYIQIPDPGAGYTLYKVVRSDGTAIPVSDQAWTTDRTIAPTGKATVDYELHILDDNSTGSYMVYYRPTTWRRAAVASITQVTSPQSGPVRSVDVTFSEPIDPSTFTAQNLTLTLNGGPNLINSSVTITQDSPTTYTIGGLAPLTTANGNYDLTINASGIGDYFGDVGSGSQSVTWATGTDVPVIVSVGAGSPSLRNTPVQSVDVVLSEPINPARSMTMRSQPDPQRRAEPHHARTSRSPRSTPTTYRIGGLAPLTAVDGDYTLTVSAAGLVDSARATRAPARCRRAGRSTRSARPSPRSRRITSRRATSSFPSLDVTFSEPIDPATFTYQNITYSKAGGPNLITPEHHHHPALADRVRDLQLQQPGRPRRRHLHVYRERGWREGPGRQHRERYRVGYLGPADDAACRPDEPGDHAEHRRHSRPDRHRLGHAHRHARRIGPDRRCVRRRTPTWRLATVNGTSFSIAAEPPRRTQQLEVTADGRRGKRLAGRHLQRLRRRDPADGLLDRRRRAQPDGIPPVASIDVTFSKPINPGHVHDRRPELDGQRRPQPDHQSP